MTTSVNELPEILDDDSEKCSYCKAIKKINEVCQNCSEFKAEILQMDNIRLALENQQLKAQIKAQNTKLNKQLIDNQEQQSVLTTPLRDLIRNEAREARIIAMRQCFIDFSEEFEIVKALLAMNCRPKEIGDLYNHYLSRFIEQGVKTKLTAKRINTIKIEILKQQYQRKVE